MTVAKRILVTGGTGTLGRAVAERLAAQGHEVRAMSLHPPADGGPGSFTWMAVDPLGGEVPQRAVDGVDAIVHCASGRRGDVEAARRHRPMLPVPFPGPVFGGYRGGGHLAPDHMVGRTTFERFLAELAEITGDTKAQPAPRTR
jgi:NAD(P)-dependent dehydrogenase (short-subunit alcohol dehydrogenase family)